LRFLIAARSSEERSEVSTPSIQHLPRVTDEARAIYHEALALQKTRDAHSRGMCPTPGGHCADCDRYVELKRQLGRLIGFNFFHGSPLEADSEDVPDYMLHNELQAGYWRRAWAIRCELEQKK
jgi:hypothetical protein